MHRFLTRPVTALALVTSVLSGCGWYTNIPASLFTHVVTPGSVVFNPPNASNQRERTVTQPVVRFRTELGSIGVNITTMKVTYLASNLTATDSSELPGFTAGISLRIEAAVFPMQPDAGRITQADQGNIIEAGASEAPIPVITRQVEQFGLNSTRNAGIITAEVLLTGNDDANIPFETRVNLPIYFLGAPGGT